jgi:hypothetical protein
MRTLPTMLIAILLATEAGFSAEVTFYVASGGSDAHSGTLPQVRPDGGDGPFGTIARAQKAVRDLKKRGPLAAPVAVYLRGVHRLDAPLVFTPEDSGTEQCPVTYAAWPGAKEKPVLSGGRAIANWTKGDGPLWIADIPQVKAGTWYFRQLFVNGRRATRARTPNEGFLRVESLVDPKPGAQWNEGVDRFRFFAGDVKPWKDLGNVEVVVFHSWNTSRVRIASVDEAARVVTFTGPTIFRPLAWDPKQRYYVENAAELLDSPGEWYLDRASGRLSYWPLDGEEMTKAEVIAPVLTELVRIDGDPDAGRLVEHLHLVGLSVQHADWTLGEKGYGDPQAAVTVPAVLTAKGARRCSVRGCEITRVGNYGLWFSRGCKENRIEQNHVHDLGAGGIRLGEAAMPPSDATESTGNLVHNNYLHDGGCVYAGAVGLWLAQGSHNTVSHNEIHSFDYSGMSVGWNWSDAPTRTLHNAIEFNHVHHVVRGVLSDAGGIYTLGTQTGSTIRNNVFHDIWPYMGSPAMAWGIYFDAGSNGITTENNVVYHTLTGGIMNTAHPSNAIRNNIFALSAWHAAWRYAWEREPSGVIERNIFYLTQGDLFCRDGGQNDVKSKWDYNLFWRTDGQPPEFYDDDFAAWQAKGLDRHGLVADPKFVDPARFDFRLQPDSPALKLGFKPIDASQAGLVGPPEWVNLPKQAKFPPTVLPPPPAPPGPVTVDDDFEKTPAGQPPGLAVVSEEDRGDSIRVSDAAAASGKHGLRFIDAPGLKHVFNPHMFYTPHFREGRATLRFDLRVDKGADLGHEWRDAGNPFRTGPSIRITPDGQLTAAGKPLAKLPIGQWVRVTITCDLGKKAAGTYDLTVTLPGQAPQRFEKLACPTARFDRLEWLGFIGLANQKVEFHLDNVKLDLASGPP